VITWDSQKLITLPNDNNTRLCLQQPTKIFNNRVLLNMITLPNDNNNRLLLQQPTNLFNKSDHIKRLVTLTLITLSGFHCKTQSKCTFNLKVKSLNLGRLNLLLLVYPHTKIVPLCVFLVLHNPVSFFDFLDSFFLLTPVSFSLTPRVT